ncbi:hypothetical protein QBC46DRAFT_237070, partial [Diplogelasinospora grovesii]
MSHLSPPPNRSCSRASLAPSDTTYHSFHDIELYEPNVETCQSPNPTVYHSPVSPLPSKDHEYPTAQVMHRQDSGYESIAPRDSRPSSSSRRRTSAGSVSSSTRRRRTRPGMQRSAKSGPVSHLPRNSGHFHRSSYQSRQHTQAQHQQQQQQPITFFQFPHFTSSEPALLDSDTELVINTRIAAQGDYTSEPNSPCCESPTSYPPPPQTTHYWTSDRTRRLEYAAIDAASRGVRGWVMRHIVPDCIVPKSKRRIGFEDDRGSVVRYRLDLDEGAE